MLSTLSECKVLRLPKLMDDRGALTFIEERRQIPFNIKRIYYLYDSVGVRGGHVHKSQQQLIIAVNGSFNAVLDDGIKRERFHLSRPHKGLYIPPLIWHELDNFSPKAIALILVSDYYDEEDTIRDYNVFTEISK